MTLPTPWTKQVLHLPSGNPFCPPALGLTVPILLVKKSRQEQAV